MSPFQELIALVPPPEKPIYTGSAETWAESEEKLGAALPPDYKALVDKYGAGSFADWFRVYNPFVPEGSSNLFSSVTFVSHHFHEGLRLRPDDMPPFRSFPGTGGLLPWAGDENGGEFCWVTSGPADTWTVINLDAHYTAEDYRVLNYTATEFLAGWFAGRITGDWYPSDLQPTQRRHFTPLQQ